MGQKFSINIQVDNPDSSVMAGTSLRGVVRLHVKRKLNPSKLLLHFCGKEATVMHRPGKPPIRDEKIIARAITTLKDTQQRSLSRGVYVLPFDFALPSSLPSSVKFPETSSNRGILGRIDYCLVAELGSFRVEKVIQVVAAPLPSDIVPCLVEPTTHEVKSFGVLNKGFLYLGASIENSLVPRGGALRISVACRNETSVNLNRVRVKLVELIEYKTQSKTAALKVELEKLKDIDLPGLDKKRSPQDEVQRRIRDGRQRTSAYQSIYYDLVSRNNQFEIVVPPWARDSYDGNLIKISHYLKITFFTKALAENPSTKIPIVIGSERNDEQREPVAERQPDAPIATIIFDDNIDDSFTTIEVGSRADFVPMAHAVVVEPEPFESQERHPLGIHETIMLPAQQMMTPTAPTESMIMEHDQERHAVHSRLTRVEEAPRTPPRQAWQTETPNSTPGAAYSPYQLYNGPRQRLPSYSYDTESGMTPICETPQRLGGDVPPSPVRDADAQWSLERLLQELKGSIHDYEVVATKMRDPGYKSLFSMLTPQEYRSIIGHVGMSHQVQVALLLAKQLVYNAAFTCAHCTAALQKTSEYFRSNMVETLLPYCCDLETNYTMIQNELNDWEKILTSDAFTAALGGR